MKFEDFKEIALEVEKEDPVDVTGLPIPLEAYRDLILNNCWEMYQTLWKSLPAEERESAMLATIAKLVLDNFVMHTRIKIAFRS